MTTNENKDDQNRSEEPSAIDNDDLDLIDPALEDEGKDDAEIWDEIEAEESGEDTEPEAGDTAEGDDTPPAEAADADTDDGDGQQPDDSQSSGDAAAADQDDPFANATDEQRAAWESTQAELKKVKQSDRSQRGRIGALQRQVNDLMKAQPAPGDNAPGEGGDDDAANGSYVDSDAFKSFESEYPEVAGPIKKLIAGLESKVNQHDLQLTAADQSRHDDFVDEQEDVLTEEHPDWEEAIAADGFGEWLEAQPLHIQEAAVRNAEQIEDAAQAADVISRFKAFQSQDGSNASNDAPSPEDKDKGNGNQSRLTGKRQRQLDSATGTQRGGPGAGHGIPEDGDEESIWNAFDKLEERQARRA